MDVTEVTKGQYYAFYAANKPTSDQVQGCAGNSSYTPRGDWPPPMGPAYGQPVHYVDWCDAYAYCTFASKELCGNIGGGKIPDGLDTVQLNTASSVGATDASTVPLDAWYNACSAEGSNLWPYDVSQFRPSACNDGTTTDAATAGIWFDTDTGGNPLNVTCYGGASGLYQMSGNVAEWENACSGSSGSSDNCAVRGGAYDSETTNPSTSDLQCKWQGTTRQRVPAEGNQSAGATLADIGFRCCQY